MTISYFNHFKYFRKIVTSMSQIYVWCLGRYQVKKKSNNIEFMQKNIKYMSQINANIAQIVKRYTQIIET